MRRSIKIIGRYEDLHVKRGMYVGRFRNVLTYLKLGLRFLFLRWKFEVRYHAISCDSMDYYKSMRSR